MAVSPPCPLAHMHCRPMPVTWVLQKAAAADSVAELQQLASGVLQRAAAAAASAKRRRAKPEVVIKQEFKALTWEEKNDITASETELLQAAMLKARLVCC